MACALRTALTGSRGAAAVTRLDIRSTTASSEKNEDDISDNVTTDDRDETWQSGRPAPGFIDLDLGASTHIDHLDLLPYQVPTPAPTTHRIWVGDSPETMQLVHELAQTTTHHKWVEGVPVGRQGRYVRVETVEHPGWVAWSGIKVFGTKEAE